MGCDESVKKYEGVQSKLGESVEKECALKNDSQYQKLERKKTITYWVFCMVFLLCGAVIITCCIGIFVAITKFPNEGSVKFLFLFIIMLIASNCVFLFFYSRFETVRDCLTFYQFLFHRKEPVSFVDLDELWKEASLKSKLIRMDRCLDRGVCSNRYLNYSLGYIMFNHDLSINALEREYLSGIHKSAYLCMHCGGVSHVSEHEECVCTYCGEPLEQEHEKHKEDALNLLLDIKKENQKKVILKMILLLWNGIVLFFMTGLFLMKERYDYQILGRVFDDAMTGIYMVIIIISFFTAGIALFRYGFRIWKGLYYYPKLQKLMEEENRPLPLSFIGKMLEIKENKVRKTVDAVLDLRVLPELYINESIGYLMYQDDIKNEQLHYAYLEKYGKERCICKNCGGENILLKYQNKICVYCGHEM